MSATWLSLESYRRALRRGALLVSLFGCASAPEQPKLTTPSHDPSGELVVPVAERMLVVAPHPDDETLAAAGLSQRVLARIGTVRTLVLTGGEAMLTALDRRAGRGDPSRDALASYAALRRREARAAARRIGGRAIRLQLLDFPDHGLLPLGMGPEPLAPPGADVALVRRLYPASLNTFTPKLPPGAKALQASILRALRESSPTLVVFPDPLDMHPDHRAAALFTLLAVREHMRGRGAPWPRLLAYLVHFSGWPPRSEVGAAAPPPRATLELPAGLPARGQARLCLPLNAAEQQRKREALDAYASQRDVMPEFLAAFTTRSECFSENTPLDAELTAMQLRPPSPSALEAGR